MVEHCSRVVLWQYIYISIWNSGLCHKESPHGGLNDAQWFKYLQGIKPCLPVEASPPGSSAASVLQFSRKHTPVSQIFCDVVDTHEFDYNIDLPECFDLSSVSQVHLSHLRLQEMKMTAMLLNHKPKSWVLGYRIRNIITKKKKNLPFSSFLVFYCAPWILLSLLAFE